MTNTLYTVLRPRPLKSYLTGPLLLTYLFFFSLNVTAFPIVERLGSKDGLSNSEVRCIFQDHEGYMWFGTYDGLNRYDGYDFKVFRNRPADTNSIIHNYVNCISEDALHNIWVGTRQGACLLNPVLGKFSSVYATIAGQPKPFRVNSYIRDIGTDRSGNVFVATQDNGLIIFDRDNQHPGREIPYQGQYSKQWNYNVVAFFIASDKSILLLIDGKGLCYYDYKTNSIKLLDATLKTGTCLYSYNEDVWIGTNIGLLHYNRLTHRFDQPLTERQGGLSFNRITSILPMPDNELWIGTDGGGLNILNRKTGKISYLTAGFDNHSLSSNAVYALYADKDSRKWIGTLRGGINVIDDVKDRFKNIMHNPVNPNSLVNNFVKSIFEDLNGSLWIGTDGGGLSIWDRKNDHFDNYYHQINQPGSISSNFITSIKQDYNKNIWLATYGNGIDRYQPETRSFKTYVGYGANGNHDRVVFWLLYEDHFKNLWASGLQDGLFLYNRKKDEFRVFDAALKNILALTQDHNGNLWCGTFTGLFKIDTVTKKHLFFSIGKPVRAIHEDKRGNLWLGTEAGLVLFNTASGHVVKQYTMDDGLCSNNVLNIEEDNQGRLWMSTYSGLSRFDLDKQTFTNFFQSDGLQNKEFNFNASLRLKSGELAFGGINGLSLFDPKNILPVKTSPNIVITDLKINNKPLSEQSSYLSARQNSILSLSIPYEEASLSINYAAIEFTSQERITYRYEMDGWDRGWNYAGHSRTAIYTRLSPGEYTFKVNCSNAEGQWIDKVMALKVIILPPWYRSWWAYTFYIGIIITCIYLYWTYKTRETRLKYEISLAKLGAENQRVLQEKERELNEKRLEFFTGISHEFRTPLSLIINPIKDLLNRSRDNDHNDLNIVYRNARRLLSLVDQLLLFRRADTGMQQLKVAPMNIVRVCNEVFLCFVQQAKMEGITFEISTTVDELTIYGDREKIEIVLFNLISNAVKYTSNSKKVMVFIEERTDDVEIRVIDSGQGIPPGIGELLFEKFYRSKDPGQPVKTGFGIGLYLAKQFTNDHCGQLTYESVPQKGTTFILQLKKGVSHYPDHIISLEESGSSELLNELADERLPYPDNADMPLPTKENFKADKIFTDKKSVLVIDDDTEIRQYIKSVMEVQYIVYEANNAEKGLLIAKKKIPNLIICDVMMPGMNGIELCAIIKHDPLLNYIPMILLTASSSPESKLKGLESGADDYISKPFEKDILIARVANLLQIRSDLQSYFYNSITLKSSNVQISEEYKQFLEKCIDVVESHLTDPDFSIKTLADKIGMSHSNLYRKVKSLSGHTINGFIRYIRLRKAAELLIQTDMNVNEVALETGFNDIKYFRTQFFKLFGINPSDFLRQKRPVFKKTFKVID